MKQLRNYFYRRDCPALYDMLMLLAVFGGAFFLFLGRAGLIEPDEGRYAEIPREMLEKWDFITPTLNYVHYFEKPPLHYWLNAISFKLFGLNEFAARFAGTLAGLLTVLLVYHAGRKLFGRRVGLFSALILGTSTGFLVQSRINFTDMTLTFFLSAALCCFIIAAEDDEPHKRRYYLLFYLFAGMAVLTKGLIGLVFPGGIIFFYLLITCRWKLLKEMRLIVGIALFLAVVVPWFVLVAQRNPGFMNFFFIHEHFERFLTKTHDRYQPIWFFVPILLLTMLPWSLYAVRALVRSVRQAWSRRRQSDGSRLVYLLAWAGIIFLFFSASHSKLVPYILPVFPPLALLVGKMFSDFMETQQERPFRLEGTILCTLFFIATIAALTYPHMKEIAPYLVKSGLVRPGSSIIVKPPILSPENGLIMACVSFFMVTVIWFSSRKRDVLILFIGLCLSSFSLEIIGPQIFMQGIEFKKSSRELALLARQTASDDTKLVTFGYEQSLAFYTGKRVIVVGGMGELEFGSKQGDQSAWFIKEPDFIRLWQKKQQVIALMKKTEYERLAPQLVPAAIIMGEKGKKMLITNHMK